MEEKTLTQVTGLRRGIASYWYSRFFFSYYGSLQHFHIAVQFATPSDKWSGASFRVPLVTCISGRDTEDEVHLCLGSSRHLSRAGGAEWLEMKLKLLTGPRL